MKLRNVLFYARNPLLLKWRKVGFNIETYRKLMTPRFQQLGIRTVLDVGANTGQSVVAFRLAFPQAVIHAIEPLPGCFAQLTRCATTLGSVHLYKTAVGNHTGTILIQQNEYSPSSSVLAMATKHKENFPYAQQQTPLSVPIDTLDNVLAEQVLTGPMLVKIDVQGYEKAVIQGAVTVLTHATLLLVEVSFTELYAGQPLFSEVCAELLRLGFRYEGIFDQLVSPLSGELLQQDAIFVRETAPHL